jgi:DNA-nicking Smr family endonuclease
VSGDEREDDGSADAVVIPITGELDLHAFAPQDVLSVVEEYLVACAKAGIANVRLVHGKGKGVQRAAVRRLLAGSPLVASFADAPQEAGGWGATIVSLHASSAL